LTYTVMHGSTKLKFKEALIPHTKGEQNRCNS